MPSFEAQFATDRKRGYRLLECVRRIQLNVINEAPVQEVYEDLLATLLEITESEYGFVGETFEDATGKPSMRARAYTDIAWDRASREFVAQADESGLLFDNLESLIGRALISSDMLISNDPGRDPRRGGLPSGHPPLRAFLGLPILRHGRMIGMIGLANRPGGYDKSLAEELEPLIVTCGSVIQSLQDDASRRKTEAELLTYREHLEELVAERTAKIEVYQKELAESRRLAFMGTLTAGIAHQINNPVGAILMGVQFALDSEHDADHDEIVKDSLTMIEAEALRCGKIVKGLLNYSKNQPSEFGSVCIREIASDAIGACGQLIQHRNATVVFSSDDNEFTILGNALELQEAVVNVITNAILSREERAHVSVRCSVAEGSACIVVQDNGAGIPDHVIDRVFEPFFSTRENNSGTGLGLSVTQGILTSHDGKIEVANQTGGGTRVSIRVPLHRA